MLRDLGTLAVTEKQLGEFWGNTTSYISNIAISYGIRALPNCHESNPLLI